MLSAPLPPEKDAEIKDLAQAIREAVDAEINELAANLASTDNAHLFGDNEFIPPCTSLGSDRFRISCIPPWGQTDLEFLVEKILNRSDPKDK